MNSAPIPIRPPEDFRAHAVQESLRNFYRHEAERERRRRRIAIRAAMWTIAAVVFIVAWFLF